MQYSFPPTGWVPINDGSVLKLKLIAGNMSFIFSKKTQLTDKHTCFIFENLLDLNTLDFWVLNKNESFVFSISI